MLEHARGDAQETQLKQFQNALRMFAWGTATFVEY
jgi:hypothetical protein